MRNINLFGGQPKKENPANLNESSKQTTRGIVSLDTANIKPLGFRNGDAFYFDNGSVAWRTSGGILHYEIELICSIDSSSGNGNSRLVMVEGISISLPNIPPPLYNHTGNCYTLNDGKLSSLYYRIEEQSNDFKIINKAWALGICEIYIGGSYIIE